MPGQPTRRAVLRLGGLGTTGVLVTRTTAFGAAVAGATLAGCTSPSTTEEPPPPPTPDERARSEAAARETQVAERASRTAVRHPELTVAASAAAAHTAHARALSETLTPSPSPTTSGGAIAVPAAPAAAADELAAAERAAAEAHRRSLVGAGVSGDVARLLASVAASDGAFALAVRSQGGSS